MGASKIGSDNKIANENMRSRKGKWKDVPRLGKERKSYDSGRAD
jgi:hypothetical protein